MSGGRPSKFTLLIAQEIIADVEAGTLFLNQIASKHRLHPDTIRNWVRVGLQEDADPELKQFADDYRTADAKAFEKTVTQIRRAAKPRKFKRTVETTRVNADGTEETSSTQETRVEVGDWKAEAFFGERRWPKLLGSSRPGGSAGLVDELDMGSMMDESLSRQDDIDQLLSDPPPELEEALLRNKDKLLALLNRDSSS